MERLNGLDKESAGRTSGEGFYYLTGDIARIHSAMLSYARDFMIDKGFTYCIPPFMIHASVVEGVMSFPEMEAMMYKIEGEDLYLIGTSEHSMIGRFLGQIVDEKSLPILRGGLREFPGEMAGVPQDRLQLLGFLHYHRCVAIGTWNAVN